MKKRVFFIFVFIMLISLALKAGTTGKLAGKVRDENNNPVPFANVTVMDGETIVTGAQTKENGTYIIINIPPGVYDVNCSQVGYKSKKVTGVQINLDETTVLNIQINSTSIEVGGFDVVENKIELVSRTKTSSGKTQTAESIEELSVDNVDAIVAIQAGASESADGLHIRGGRANEVVYTVDGMSVSDPVDGESALTIDTDAIQHMSTMTGGFTAEYGNAQSGIVNIVTKSGSKDYSGKLEFSTDHLLSGIDNSNSDKMKFAVGGPVLSYMVNPMRDKFTFFFNVSTNWHDSRYHNYYQSNAFGDLKYLTSNWSEYPEYDKYSLRNDFAGFDLGDRNYNLYNANLKVKYKFNPRQNVTFSVSGDRNYIEPYSHAWKYALDHYLHFENEQNLYKMTYDHTFNAQTNLKVKAGLYRKATVQGPIGVSVDDYINIKSGYSPSDTLVIQDPYFIPGLDFLTYNGTLGDLPLWQYFSPSNANLEAIPGFVSPGTIYGFNRDDENTIMTLRSDFEYQYNQIHGFKTGFEIMKHYIKKDQLSNPWIIDPYRFNEYLKNYSEPVDSVYNEVEESYVYKYLLSDLYSAAKSASGYTEGYEANPWQGAYYLQDRMEWEGMIVNAGLRFDFWYLGNKYKIFKDEGYIWEEFEKSKRFQMMISPRLGISHPISETSVLHFAYNYQNQLPQMQYIFTTATWEDAITNPGTIVGAPDLEPQITVTYEVGLQKQLSDDFAFDIAAYFKNIYNYITTEKVSQAGEENVYWYQLISEDYGSARGIDFNIEKRHSNFLSGSASYSLAWADGNNSGLTIQDEAINLREFPLNWDMRHNFSFNIAFRIAQDEEYFLPFTDFALPWDNFSINFLYNIASGTPYTPRNDEDTDLDTNSAQKPFTENASITVNKKFPLKGNSYFKIYSNISNLFNRKNVYYVYPKTGSPYTDGQDLSDDDGYTPVEKQYLYDLYANDPSNVSSGRTITFGVSFHW